MYRTLLPLVYWELEESVRIHTYTTAELISPGEDPTVYSVGDNCLVKRTTKEYATICW